MVRTDNVDYSATHFGLSGVREIKKIHEGQNSFGKELADKIMSFVQENEALSNRSLTKHLSSLEWRALENHVVHINFDAAFSQQLFRYASGLVARNERGVIVSKSANRIASSFAVEAFACSQAVRLGMGMGVDAVEIEGDTLIVIKKCQSNVEDKSNISC
ncbi:hypothetical protein Goshw_000500, partial [Gossypium schwendimanii]|nr:hypothetical protein [Gossypium schwendimanii]